MTFRQRYEEVGLPWRKTIGSPEPTSRYAIARPPTSMCGLSMLSVIECSWAQRARESGAGPSGFGGGERHVGPQLRRDVEALEQLARIQPHRRVLCRDRVAGLRDRRERRPFHDRHVSGGTRRSPLAEDVVLKASFHPADEGVD